MTRTRRRVSSIGSLPKEWFASQKILLDKAIFSRYHTFIHWDNVTLELDANVTVFKISVRSCLTTINGPWMQFELNFVNCQICFSRKIAVESGLGRMISR